MTPQPWTVAIDDSLAVARRMMAEREVHHLPVLDGAAVAGLVTARDLELATDRLGTVADLLVPTRPIARDTPLEDVLELMTAKHWDAVTITEEDRVVGIFTTTDALRVLAELVRHAA